MYYEFIFKKNFSYFGKINKKNDVFFHFDQKPFAETTQLVQ